jgi:hypothetical protein
MKGRKISRGLRCRRCAPPAELGRALAIGRQKGDASDALQVISVWRPDPGARRPAARSEVPAGRIWAACHDLQSIAREK